MSLAIFILAFNPSWMLHLCMPRCHFLSCPWPWSYRIFHHLSKTSVILHMRTEKTLVCGQHVWGGIELVKTIQMHNLEESNLAREEISFQLMFWVKDRQRIFSVEEGDRWVWSKTREQTMEFVQLIGGEIDFFLREGNKIVVQNTGAERFRGRQWQDYHSIDRPAWKETRYKNRGIEFRTSVPHSMTTLSCPLKQ